MVYLCLYNTGTIDFYHQFDYRVMAFVIFLFLSPMVFIHDFDTYNLSDALFLIGSILFISFGFNLIINTRNYDISYIEQDIKRNIVEVESVNIIEIKEVKGNKEVNEDNPNTTPAPNLLYKVLNKFLLTGSKYVSIEAAGVFDQY